MKRILLLFVAILIIGCATIGRQAKGTIIEKFARSSYAEHSALQVGDKWIPVPIGHMPTFWVSVQGSICRIEMPMKKEDWDKVKVGDLIAIEGEDGGGA